MAKNVASQLEEKGHVTRGWLGVGIQDLTPDLTKSFGLTDKKGALVSQVMPGSPAAKAGIEQGDVILEFDGKAIAESKDLPQMVAATPVDKSVDVKVYRNGKTVDREVKISAMEETAEASTTSMHKKTLGISVQNLTPELARRLRSNRDSGVVVTRVEPGSPAAEAGIQTGDIIREVNRKTVKDADDLIQKIEQAKDQNNILLLVQRGQNNMFAAVTPK
jgi:serine protease Do